MTDSPSSGPPAVVGPAEYPKGDRAAVLGDGADPFAVADAGPAGGVRLLPLPR